MSSYSIATTGLSAAQTALDVIGNNVANAATEGYHRQRVELAPNAAQGGEGAGGGVDVLGITQLVDELLERQILAQESTYAQIDQELTVLSSIESMLGEFAEGTGLNETLDSFFQSLEDLAANPLDSVSRNAVVSTAQTLASEFRRLGQALEDLRDQTVQQAQATVENINALTSEIATLNARIHTAEVAGNSVNNLRDQRDTLISDLAEMVDIEVRSRDFGVVDVYINGLTVIPGTKAEEISLDLQPDQTYSVSMSGSEASGVSITGGTLGGLLSIINGSLTQIQSDLDTIAQNVIVPINDIHVQGLGTDGSFSELTGWAMDDDLTQSNLITDGTFYIRVTDASTGAVTRHAINVDVSSGSPDTLTSIAGKIDAITGLTAAVESGQLDITAAVDYTFDFIPAVLSEPTASNLTAASAPSVEISGIYSGNENDTFTFTVSGTGSIGNGALSIEVTNLAGEVVGTFNAGDGYAAGDTIEVADGIEVSLSIGDFNAGDTFEVDVFADTDSSGLLAAVGMNAFFSGTGASDMYVADEIARTPNRVATASGRGLTDNTAIQAMAALADLEVDSLSGKTVNGYYQAMVTNLGQDISLKESRQENTEAILQNLETQRSEVSGVDLNEEAASMLIYQQMFQAMSQYMVVVRESLDTLIGII